MSSGRLVGKSVPSITLTTGTGRIQATMSSQGLLPKFRQAGNKGRRQYPLSLSLGTSLSYAKGDVISKKHKLGERVETLEELINEGSMSGRSIAYVGRESVFVSAWKRVYPISWLVNMRMTQVLELIREGMFWLEKY